MTSSAYIRLILPLTSEIKNQVVDLVQLDPTSDDLTGFDATIVSRTAFDTLEQAERFVANARRNRVPVVVDVDDAFHLMDEQHPEYARYQPKLEALKLVLTNADEIWCSTSPLQGALEKLFGRTALIFNTLDPRLWRTYRSLGNAMKRNDSGRVELLDAGSGTHGKDLEMIMPILDELAADFPFRLTVIGISPNIPERPWIQRMSPGKDAAYPRFVPWLRRRASLFDIGIAPLIKTPFNHFKSDLKVLEYLAMGLVPIASASQPYLDSPAIDKELLCADVGEWRSRLMWLAADAEELRKQKQAATDRIGYVWEQRNAGIVGNELAARLEKLAGS